MPQVRQKSFPPRTRGAAIVGVRDHLTGNWGELPRADAKANDEPVRTGEDVLSKFRYNGMPLFVITQGDRALTTILLCDEY
jgi:hypothetical protein